MLLHNFRLITTFGNQSLLLSIGDHSEKPGATLKMAYYLQFRYMNENSIVTYYTLPKSTIVSMNLDLVLVSEFTIKCKSFTMCPVIISAT